MTIERIAKVPCPHCDGRARREWEDTPCAACQGTGYRFGWLWTKCYFSERIERPCWRPDWKPEGADDYAKHYHVEYRHTHNCPIRNCMDGYVLIEGPGERVLGLLEVQKAMGWLLWISYTASQYHVEILQSSTSADELYDALAAAIVEALGITDA